MLIGQGGVEAGPADFHDPRQERALAVVAAREERARAPQVIAAAAQGGVVGAQEEIRRDEPGRERVGHPDGPSVRRRTPP